MSRRGSRSGGSGSVAGVIGLLVVLLLSSVPMPPGAVRSIAPPGPAVGAPPALHVGQAIPVHPPSHPLRLAGRASVNPNAVYTSEPAPMGIGDFGVDAAGNGYTYQTSAFYGNTIIQKLTVYNAQVSTPYAMTIQLNIVLTFTVAGVGYDYWVQDVAFLDTQSKNLWFENNIWNFSSSGAGLDSHSVSGNGTIYSGAVYIAGASPALAGNNITLKLPAQIGLLASVHAASSGRPEVVFQYRDTGGWVTYDNAIFPFAISATNVNYTVDGTGYNPIGLYNDAELTLGGPGNGAGTAAQSGQLSMTLSYYNGRNFQSVANAYDFGSDTAEAISGLHPSLGANRVNGSLADNLTFGVGSPGALYNSTYDGSVEIVTQATSGSLELNGTTGVAFARSPLNVTLAPGNYSFGIYVSGSLVGGAVATLDPGAFLLLYIDAGTVSTVTFVESGLPAGTAWSVSFASTSQTVRSASLAFRTINGSFQWRLTPIPGFIANATSGTLTVKGADQTLPINFTQVVYPASLIEIGLPNGTAWSVVIGNRTFNSTTIAVDLTLPNGSFGYQLGPVPGWISTGSERGTLHVAGAAVQLIVHFRAFTYAVVFHETGIPTGAATWGVVLDGVSTNASGPTVATQAPNGSSSYRVLSPSGWVTATSTGQVTVAAAPVNVSLTFTPFPFAVTFVEYGLDAGVGWGVQVGQLHQASPNATIVFELGNGSYTYQLDEPLGYGLLTPVNSTFNVLGGALTVTVIYAHVAAIQGTLSGTLVPAGAMLLVDGTQEATPGGVVELNLTAGAHALEVTASGYVPYFTNVTIVAGGVYQLGAIVLASTGGHGVQPVHHSSPSTNSSIAIAGIPLMELVVGLGLVVLLAVLGVALALRRPKT